jgi:hypothetical protein
MPYVPPHLRPGYVKPEPPQAPAPRGRGAHFRSSETGLPSHNLTHHVYNRNAPPINARRVTMLRLLSRKPIKSALKGKKQQTKRARSNSPKRRRHLTIKAKSK